MYHETVVQVPPVVEDMVPRSQLDDLRSINTQLQERMAELRAEQLRLRDEVDTALACQREAEQELVNFKRRITERMHREADRRQWCSEYDDIMEEMGLERRSREWRVEFQVSASFDRVVMARDADTAERLAREEMPLRQYENYRIGGVDMYIGDIECEVSQDD